MITFTLRLQDLENDALDRLAYVYGLSKNKLLNVLIAREYNRLSCGLGKETTEDDELFEIAEAGSFADEMEFLIYGCAKNDKPNRHQLKQLLKCYDYSIEHAEDPEDEERLTADRAKVVEALRHVK